MRLEIVVVVQMHVVKMHVYNTIFLACLRHTHTRTRPLSTKQAVMAKDDKGVAGARPSEARKLKVGLPAATLSEIDLQAVCLSER